MTVQNFNTSGGAINQSVDARRCLTGFTEPLRGCYSHGHDTSLLAMAIDPAMIASTCQAHVAEDTSFVLATAAAMPESASIFVTLRRNHRLPLRLKDLPRLVLQPADDFGAD